MAEAIENGRGRLAGKWWLVFVAAVLGLGALAAYLSTRRSEAIVRTSPVYCETITNGISTNGKIEPIEGFEAHAPISTTVKRVDLHQGDWVKPGQMLLQLDDADARAQAARAEAQLKGAEAEFQAVSSGGTREEVLSTSNALVKAQADRDAAQRNLQAMQRLLPSGSASQAEVDAAQAQVRVADSTVHMLEQKLHDRFSGLEIGHVAAQQTEAKAALAAAREVIRNSNVASPLAGMVYNLPFRQGAFVNAGDLLAQVADLHHVRVRAFIDEPEIGRLQKGQVVEVTWDAVPGRVWTGTIENLPTTVVQRGTRMVGEITCLLDNADLKLLPNNNVSVSVVIARHENALTVPREAIHQDDRSKYVFQIVNGRLKRRDVQTSVANLTRVEVTSGLSPDAVLALGAVNLQALRDGMPVRGAN